MRLTKREGILLSILGVFLIIYLFHTYIYSPLVVERQKLINENKELEAIALLVSNLGEGKSGKILEEKMQEFERLNKKVPEDDYIPETIKEIEDMSKENRVKLLKTQYFLDEATNETEEGTRYQECLFEIDVLGSYSNLTKFVRKLEKADRLYTISSIKMTLVQSNEEDFATSEEIQNYTSNSLIMNLTFKSYYDNISWDDIKGANEIVYKNETPSNPFAVK